MRIHGHKQTPTGRRSPSSMSRLPRLNLQWGVKSPGSVPDPRFREPRAGVKGSSHPVPACDLTPHPSLSPSISMERKTVNKGVISVKPIIPIFLVLLLAFSPLGASAQSRYRRDYPQRSGERNQKFYRQDSVDEYRRALGYIRPGTKVIVQKINGNWVRGKLVGVDLQKLTVERHRKLVDIPRKDIDRVWLLGDDHMEKGGETGSAIGIAVGFLGLGKWGWGGMAGSLLVGTMVGSIVGANSHDKHILYESPARRFSTRAIPSAVDRATHSQSASNAKRRAATRLKLPRRNLDPTLILQQLTYIPTHTDQLVRSMEE